MTRLCPQVSGPIVFRAERNGPEYIAHPYSAAHRALFLQRYIVLSCSRCTIAKSEDDTMPRSSQPEYPGHERLTYTAQEAAEILGCSVSRVYDSVRSGELPSIRLGRAIRIPKAPLLRMLDPQEDS